MDKKKALVTGASGFIGSHLVNALHNYDIKTISHELLNDPIGLRQEIAMYSPNYIFHLAAYGNMSNQKDEDEIVKANSDATYNLLQASKDIPYQAFINVSSSSVTLPHLTLYAATKLGGEALCKAFADEYKKPIVTVRPYSVYGPGEADFRFIPTVFRSCITGEKMQLAEGWHDWIYIDDIVEAISLCPIAAGEVGASGGVAELGTGINTSNYEIVKIIETITGRKANINKKVQLRSFDTKDWVCKRTLYNYPVQIKEGLQKCYEYYKGRYDR